MNNFEETILKHQELFKKIKEFLDKNGFKERESTNLLDSRFGYPFSPSAGHHIIDDIVISKKEEADIMKWYVVPDKSIRMYDVEKIGISSRHLTFFESIPFGYAGSGRLLPREESVKIYSQFLTEILGLDKEKILVTVLGSCEAEGLKIDEEEDEIFRKTWEHLIGKDKVFKTSGRRNLFYSRIKGNPGGTGQEVYYKIGDKYVEIGSAVNYKFQYVGSLQRTTNQAIIQGVGLERVLMALENNSSIYDTSLLKPFKDVILKFLQSQDDKSVELYDDTLNVIADHIRAISFIIYDGQELDNSERGRILKKFIKNFHSQFIYLGIKKEDEFLLINRLFDVLVELFSNRYKDISKAKERVGDFIRGIVDWEKTKAI